MRSLHSVPGHDEVQIVSVPEPVAGPGRVVVELVATAVQPVDPFFATETGRQAFGVTDETGLGWDLVGRVVATGPDVTAYRVGDVVAALDDQLFAADRTQADLVALDVDALALVPEGLDPLDAATVPLNALTAAQALDLLGDADGRDLLVTGAGGAVGGYALALAVSAGWSVTGLGRERDEAFVRSTGAAFTTQLDPASYDAVLDPASIVDAALAAVRDGGTYVGVQSTNVPESERVTTTAVMVHRDGDRLAELLARSASGELEVRVAGTVPLAEAATAYAKVAAGGQRGRWLLVP
ncbi:zinc-binding dehydrogenase [Nocardioides agariphilus]|jgi:NADPH:quinone reductase-like Zn-dependent oxidoreductase|uniref:Zinc-binding dehydrogenase n=1 Tax=Nocardioides agariphilus TaxID=433664 RepID=A0A930VSW9_9ACTN|nr:zinc-binding dehydrogenase [Nocardioides agariphilus]MBF4770393.1 zinc-binding dehydrogenase [Nocardioides agariphilus]